MRNRLSVVLPFPTPRPVHHEPFSAPAVAPLPLDEDPTLELAHGAIVRILAGPPRRTFLQLLEQLIAG